jgi:hypothetical protein
MVVFLWLRVLFLLASKRKKKKKCCSGYDEWLELYKYLSSGMVGKADSLVENVSLFGKASALWRMLVYIVGKASVLWIMLVCWVRLSIMWRMLVW